MEGGTFTIFFQRAIAPFTVILKVKLLDTKYFHGEQLAIKFIFILVIYFFRLNMTQILGKRLRTSKVTMVSKEILSLGI